MRRGRPRLRWKDCVKREARKGGGDEGGQGCDGRTVLREKRGRQGETREVKAEMEGLC